MGSATTSGTFALSYGFKYTAIEWKAAAVRRFSIWNRYDTFDWYLSLGSLANVNAKHLHGKIPTWNNYVAHPDYDEFWKRQDDSASDERESATLGWWE